ncbi:MAG TPA: hypothetical protein VMD77_02710 [Candidatus Baltobacteraceae bacterium]|jgi:hypothetical protein|nr:hypothetical protein [Candidatus Baltobacteraceae bacterium]
MSAFVQERRMGGPATFAIALLLLTPSIVAFYAASAIANQADLPVSGLWFLYEMSLYFGCAGVAIVAALTLSAGLGRRFSRVYVWLMAAAAVGGASLLWYAAHIYRNPWMPNTWPAVM